MTETRPTTSGPDDEIAIRVENVSKRYDRFRAVDDVSLTVRAGEVHSLVGANGAGKSTLLGVLSGRIASSSGTIRIFGEEMQTGRPREARRMGISAVYQELTVLPNLSARANVFLGNEAARAGLLDERAMRRRYAELSEFLDIRIPGEISARELTVAAEQQLEIMRAVGMDSRILLLDEPTAALSYRERESLLGVIRRLKARGVTIVLVTHNLDEVLAVSDRITVMRNARKVETGPGSRWTKRELVRAMTGTEPVEVAKIDRGGELGEVLLEVVGVTVPGAISDVSFQVRRGEVLGVAGLVGSGRTTLFRSITGAESKATGEMVLHGRRQSLPRTPREAQRRGLSLVPEDRKTEGLILGMSIGDNITLSALGRVARAGMISGRRQLAAARDNLSQFTLQRPVGNYPVGDLSGGGQQKVVIGRALFTSPEILVVDEPTRGIDVSAKAEVLRELRRVAHELGRAVIVTSSETEEVIEVSDRIIVMSQGRQVGELDYTDGPPTMREVLDLAFGAGDDNDMEQETVTR